VRRLQSLTDVEARLCRLDSKIKPVAERPVDISDPNALTKLETEPHPLDETGTRAEAENLILELVSDYIAANTEWRIGARALFRRYRSFAWAAQVPLDTRTRDGFRAHLVMFSLMDQGADPRDAKLWLSSLCEEARQRNLEIDSVLRDVASMSSDEDRYGWGSTRRWLEDDA